jgi:hypothetical protein
MTMAIEDGHQPKGKPNKHIATGFDLEAQADGNVLIEFFGDDGTTFNEQIVTPSVVANMPLVATLTGVALREGSDAVKEVMAKLNERQKKDVNDDK